VITQSFFRQNGYYRAPGALTPLTSSKMRAQVRKVSSFSKNQIELDTEGRVVRLEGVASNMPVLKDLANSRFCEYTEQLLGQDWLIILNRHNHITIDYGAEGKSKRFHRDASHWTRSYINVLIMLSAETLHIYWPKIVPGSHLWPISGPSNGGGYWLDEDANKRAVDQALSVPLQTGDMLLLDPFVFHAAGYGVPSNPRIVLTLAIRTGDELALHDGPNELRVSGGHAYRGQQGWLRTASEQ
jgi:Phytanoyl-CoA dioxygenase (PhyH)